MLRKSHRSLIRQGIRAYNSYPAPGDVPVVTTFVSKQPKPAKNLHLNEKFRIEKMFPGVNVETSVTTGAGPQTLTSVLPNGLTIASQDARGLMSSFIVLVKSGSADEVQDGSSLDNTGSTQVIELAAFQSTPTRDAQKISSTVEGLGGMVQCISSRENIIYCIDALRCNAEEALEILADCILHPVLAPEELDEAKTVISFLQDSLPADQASRDAINIAAYANSPMGNFHYCSEAAAAKLTHDTVRKFHAEHFVASNMVVAGAGIEHDLLVDIVNRKFQSISNAPVKKRAPSKYTGGLYLNERELKEPFVKVAIGFEFCKGWSDKNLVPGIVLQTLLGGGSSFSAGGPGKGMYTRLYRQLLNQYHWVESAEALVAANDDSGLLAIDGACPADHVDPLIQVIVSQFVALSKTQVSEEELSRAKNMAKSTMLMQLESRLVNCEDIARQTATYSFRKNIGELCAKIDAVTAADLQQLATHMMTTPPSISAVGPKLDLFPPYAIIRQYIGSLL